MPSLFKSSGISVETLVSGHPLSNVPGTIERDFRMTATVTQHRGDHYEQVRAELAQQSYQHTVFTLELVARFARRVAAATGRALMRWAVAYERTAQERIMRELALSHPTLVNEIRAARSTAASEAIRRSPVIGMWE